MFKKALILFLSSFIGIVLTPGFLIASEDVTVTGLNEANIVQTVIVEPEPTPQPVAAPVRAHVATKTTSAAPVYTASANRINIAGRSIAVEYTNSTAVDAGNVVKFYNNKFLYGHNSGNVFGFLPSVGVGQTFSVTYNGVTTNYLVSGKYQYEKTSATTLGYNGVNIGMGHVANGFSPDEVRHNLVIMTCSGTSLGGGDATHRLVLFADAI